MTATTRSSSPAPSSDGPVLRLREVSKHFGGVVALRGVDFELAASEIHALCGENGAGKSTLIKILSGVYPIGSYDGEYLLDGQLARFRSHADAKATGIAVIYQELALCADLTVAENIFLGQEPRRGFWGLIDDARMVREASELLHAFGIELDPRATVGKLGVGQRQLVEIAKALARRSRVLILDEPTAALSEREAAVLKNLVCGLRERGAAIVYISHKLDEVFALADRITVLRDGRSILTRPAAELSPGEVIREMCGRAVTDLFPAHGAPSPEHAPLLSVRKLSVSPTAAAPLLLSEISFDVAPGEVVGIGGLLGSGRTELLLHLFGAWGVRRSGSVTLAGQDFAPSSPAAALVAQVALLTEDRRRFGLCMDESVDFNLSLSSLLLPTTELVRHGMIDPAREASRNLDIAERVRLRSAAGAQTRHSAVRTLSGGNQQKVVLGKALLTAPRLLLLDEPTRGIDIGARQEIYELVRTLCKEGLAVLLVSSELLELLGLCDRILMLHSGTLAGQFRRDEATSELLLTAALGRTKEAA